MCHKQHYLECYLCVTNNTTWSVIYVSQTTPPGVLFMCHRQHHGDYNTMETTTPWRLQHNGDYNTMETTTPWGLQHHGDYNTMETTTQWRLQHHGDYNTMETTTPWGLQHHGDYNTIEEYSIVYGSLAPIRNDGSASFIHSN